MNNHFTVTINDDHGVKQFNIHQFVKKAIAYAVLFLGIIALVAVATILYLNYTVDQIELKKSEVQSAYMQIKQKNKELDAKMRKTHLSFLKKQKELSEVSDSLSEIETMIGISQPTQMSLQERAEVTKLTSEHIATLFQFIPSGSPIEYKGVTSKFGYRIHPTLNRKEFHRGTDLKAAMNTSVYAPADAYVEYAGFHKRSGFGRLVILHHNFGFRSYYGHLNKVLTKSGRFVKKGDLIGLTGNSGMSNGPHLHYELRFMGRAVNPFWFIKWNVEHYKDIFEKEKKIPWQSLIAATANIKVSKPTQIPQSSQLAQQ